jgi:hypothetical protein
VDPVSGTTKLEISFKLKALSYVIGFAKCLPLLIITNIFFIISFNMRGFALVDHGLLHWEGIYKLSESGAIFDKNTKKKFYAIIIHVIVFNRLSLAFTELCEKVSKIEFHQF